MPITVLLVDDSEIIRFLFAKSLERDLDISVVATACDGLEAITLTKQHQPDVIVLDIDMPVMGGLEALPQLLSASPHSHIIMISADPRADVESVFKALQLGAIDFSLKPGAEGSLRPAEFNQMLRQQIKSLCARRQTATPLIMPLPRPPLLAPALELASDSKSPSRALAPQPALPRPSIAVSNATPAPIYLQAARHLPIAAIAIAAATGGPEAIIRLLHGLGHGIDHLPIFIAQHMKPLFTSELANQVIRRSKRLCKEALSGEMVTPGMAYIAPGGYQMLVKKHGKKSAIQLTQDTYNEGESHGGDALFTSVADSYGGNVLGIILSGMGTDGTSGAQAIVHAGGSVIAQDAASSTIDEMPQSVARAGLCEAILPLDAMGDYILKRCSEQHA